MAFGMGEWVAVRVFDAQAAEAASVGAGATFIGIGGFAPRVEVRIRWGSETSPLTTGSTGPTGVTLAVWRSHAGKVDRIGTLSATVSSNAALVTEPAIFECGANAIYVTVLSFVGGTSPTLTGTVDARALAR